MRMSDEEKAAYAKSLFCKMMVGRYCHSWKADGILNYQGRIEGIESGSFRIQLFEWGFGTESDVIRVPFSDFLEQWTYYPDSDAMIWAYDLHKLKKTLKSGDYIVGAYLESIHDRLDSGEYPPLDRRDAAEKKKAKKAA